MTTPNEAGSTKYGDFGDDLNNLLNKIGNYCVTNKLSAREAESMFNIGMTARHLLVAPLPTVPNESEEKK